MVLLFISLGLLFFLSNIMIDVMPENRALFGGILMAYGLFRAYRMKTKNKTKDEV